MVKNSDPIASYCLLANKLWCVQVTKLPDKSNINVLRNGISHGLKTNMPLGGQNPPISTVGESELWKKAQKKPKKNKTSERIKRNTPNRKPCWTIPKCLPSYVPSRTISLNHWNITNTKKNKLNCNVESTSNPCNHWAKVSVKESKLTPIKKGQGDIYNQIFNVYLCSKTALVNGI